MQVTVPHAGSESEIEQFCRQKGRMYLRRRQLKLFPECFKVIVVE